MILAFFWSVADCNRYGCAVQWDALCRYPNDKKTHKKEKKMIGNRHRKHSVSMCLYYRNGWMDHLNRFVPPQALDPFSNRTQLHCGTFLTECNSTAVTPPYLTTGSATIPMPPYVFTGNTPALRHTTSIPVLTPHSAIPSSIRPLPFYFARPGALPKKGTLLKTKLKIK